VLFAIVQDVAPLAERREVGSAVVHRIVVQVRGCQITRVVWIGKTVL